MGHIDRREALALFASAPVAAALTWTPAEVAAGQRAAAVSAGGSLRFFSEEEYETLRVLVDLILNPERLPERFYGRMIRFVHRNGDGLVRVPGTPLMK